MLWLPPADNFRADLLAARSAASGPERLNRLAAVARHRLSYLETLALDRVLGHPGDDCRSEMPSIRLALLASTTVDHLIPGIRVGALRRGLLAECHAAGYGQYRQELLQPLSTLHQFKPDAVLLSISAREAIASIPIGATRADADEILNRTIREIRELWSEARKRLNATVIQQTFLNVSENLFGSHDRMVWGSPSRLIDRLNELLLEAARSDAVALLDIAHRTERDGIDAWFDEARWLQAKMEIAPAAVPMYGELLARVIGAQRGASKKCLVLDLDNTLWGGVIGDMGIEGIVLGQGSAEGEAYIALQRYAQQLAQRGIILAVCSKNDARIAEEAFAKHPEMILKRAQIAAFVANWEPKPSNLQRIAKQLNLGLDALVFVDDNPVERAAVRQALPMVAVPELPADPAQYVRCIADAGYFEAVAFTADDQQRSEQYAANASRDALLASGGDLQEFLAGLQMTVVYGPARDVDLTRVIQLINKTNQFNTTTRRYTSEEVVRSSRDPDVLVLQFRLIDRFGDNGLVSVMILSPHPLDAGALQIDTWVMSCRVFGRELEFEAMNIAVEWARERGARALRGDFVPTAKNAVIANLYPQLGFSRTNASPAATDAQSWEMSLAQYEPRRTHITRNPQTS
jgi:FkbH-like protein